MEKKQVVPKTNRWRYTSWNCFCEHCSPAFHKCRLKLYNAKKNHMWACSRISLFFVVFLPQLISYLMIKYGFVRFAHHSVCVCTGSLWFLRIGVNCGRGNIDLYFPQMHQNKEELWLNGFKLYETKTFFNFLSDSKTCYWFHIWTLLWSHCSSRSL